MQKISSYLYSNRIPVNLDLTTSPLEWRIVYQRTVKIYKGYDNVIELDIKNAEQRRFDVSGLTLKCLIMDELGQEIYTAPVVHTAAIGISKFTIPKVELDYLTPQFLRYVVYKQNNDGTRNVIYGDTQFDATGRMDLLDSAEAKVPAPQIIDTFTYLHSTINDAEKVYYSEAVEVNPLNDIRENTEINLEFWCNAVDAFVHVQISTDQVVSTGTEWSTLETFTVTSTTNRVFKTYNSISDFSNNIGWLRITYKLLGTNTGNIDRVIVRS